MTDYVRSGFVCIAMVRLVTTLASPADAQNLLANPAFGADVSGWTEANSNVAASYRGDLGSTLPGGSRPGALEMRFSF
jgi:hypothetical protein